MWTFARTICWHRTLRAFMGGARSSGESFSVSGLRTAGIKGHEAVIWLDLERRGSESQPPVARSRSRGR